MSDVTEAEVVMQCCEGCKQSFAASSLKQVEGKGYCTDCFHDRFRCCNGCEAQVEAGDAVYSELHSADYCMSCADEYLAYCRSCDDEISLDRSYCDDAGDRYCDSCWSEHEHSDDDESDHVQHHELWGSSFQRCTSKRKYGVEIEACLENEDDRHLSLDKVGTWSSQHDGSLGSGGREYASAILQGDEGFAEIESFTEKLRTWGYRIENCCGLHVHIDGRDLCFEDIRKLLKIVLTYEPVIYAMLPSRRYTGSYSVPLDKFPKSRFRKKVTDEKDLMSVWYGANANVDLKSKYHHSRYYGINIHSWFYRRSIEFRYHSGTMNPIKITRFIKICQGLVDKAKAVKSAKVHNFKSFQDRFESFVSFVGYPPELAVYMRQRILKFHPDLFEPTAVAA